MYTTPVDCDTLETPNIKTFYCGREAFAKARRPVRRIDISYFRQIIRYEA